MDISIIIVNYKSKEKTRACLESISQSDLVGINYEIIIIDNASGDNLLDLKNIIDFKLINSPENLGMGGGNNLGIKEAQGDFLLILNPDTVLTKNAIKILFSYIKDNEDVAIIGPRLLNLDGSLQYSCSRFPKFYTPLVRRTFLKKIFKRHEDYFLMKKSPRDIIKEVDWLMGSCLLIRKDGFSGFDKRFFMYFEDIDICRQAHQKKMKVIYHPQAEVFHHHTRASAQAPWYRSIFVNKMAREHIKSWLKYFLKWACQDSKNKKIN